MWFSTESSLSFGGLHHDFPSNSLRLLVIVLPLTSPLWDMKYPKNFEKGIWLRSHNDWFFLKLLNSKWLFTTLFIEIWNKEAEKKKDTQ